MSVNRSVALGLTVLAMVISGCGTPKTSAAVVEVAAGPRAAIVDADVTPAAAKTAPSHPVPEPKPAPEPVRPVLPDGTEIHPCEAAPPQMACIPGGAFVRGTDQPEPKNARPSAEIWAQTFYMDLYEVTYAQYRECWKAGRCPRSGPRYTDFDHPNMPVQGVSWFDAVAYCTAQGKQLPTEAQWEKAARGPKGQVHPWGDEPATCERAIIRDSQGRSCGLKKAKSKPEVGRPWDVGSKPAGVYGLFDMAGNSWEWVADWYSRSYEACGDACEGIDPRGPCQGASTCSGHRLKIVRGGSWYWEAAKATGIYRRSHFPTNEPFHHFGFRCAATVAQAHALSPQP